MAMADSDLGGFDCKFYARRSFVMKGFGLSKLTQTGKLIIAAVSAALVTALLYAPHSIEERGQRLFFGYGWIFSPPRTPVGIGDLTCFFGPDLT